MKMIVEIEQVRVPVPADEVLAWRMGISRLFRRLEEMTDEELERMKNHEQTSLLENPAPGSQRSRLVDREQDRVLPGARAA